MWAASSTGWRARSPGRCTLADGTVAVGFIHDDQWDCWFGHSLLRLMCDDLSGPQRIGGRYIGLHSGPMLDAARNQLVRAFLEHTDKPEWLLMVDTDMTFTTEDFYRLLTFADERERPVCAGLCFAGSAKGRIWPVMLVARPDDADAAGFVFREVRGYPKDRPCRVDATGAAFMLCHRRVFTEMLALDPDSPAPWFRYAYMGGRQFGEDVPFCIRCRTLGVPIYVHTGVKIGHVKSKVIDEAAYEEWVTEHGHEDELEAVRV